jgi:hypothetical protein
MSEDERMEDIIARITGASQARDDLHALFEKIFKDNAALGFDDEEAFALLVGQLSADNAQLVPLMTLWFERRKEKK